MDPNKFYWVKLTAVKWKSEYFVASSSGKFVSFIAQVGFLVRPNELQKFSFDMRAVVGNFVSFNPLMISPFLEVQVGALFC